jgi:hypothetical protein
MFIKKAEFHDDSILVKKKNFEGKFPKEVLGKKKLFNFLFFHIFHFFRCFLHI